MCKKPTKEILIELVDKGLMITQIAKKLKCSNATISNYCKKFNIKLGRYKHLSKTGYWDNYKWLYKAYILDKKSIRDISKEINLAIINTRARLLKYGIPLRTSAEGTRLRKNEISTIMKQKWKNSIFRENQLKARYSVWQRPEYKEAFAKLMIKRWEDKDYRDKMTLQSKRLHKSPEYIKKKLNSLRGKNKSILEDVFAYFLDEIKIAYKRHCIVGEGKKAREFDFQLKDKTLIEIDGSFYHTISHVKANDAYKTNMAKQLKLPLIRIKEETFYESDLFHNFCDILNIKPIVEKINLKDIVFDLSAKVNDCNKFFRLYHYLHNCGRYGIAYRFLCDNETVAMAIVSTPIRKESATSIGYNIKEVREIARFAINPKFFNKNLGSWAICKIRRDLMSRKINIKALIAFADPAIGHTGGLYKAAGFKEVGRSSVDYWYETQDGLIIHKKTLYNRAKAMKMKEVEFAVKFELVRYYYPGKIKFLYEFN